MKSTENQIVAATADLVKIFGDSTAAVTALNGVSAQFHRSTFTAIMGSSGSGKSTFLHCLAGLEQATSGRIFLGESDITQLNDRKLTAMRRNIGFVFQQFNLLPTLTAAQNILLPLELFGAKVDKGRFDEIVASLDLATRMTHFPAQLSGGQQQRVAIARALITNPQVIFADEPTGALDLTNSKQLLSYLRRCADLGQTIVMVTHDPIAARYVDRAIILSDGKIVADLDSPNPEQVSNALGRLGVDASLSD